MSESTRVPIAVHPSGTILRALSGGTFSGAASTVDWDDAVIGGGDCHITPNIYSFLLRPDAPPAVFRPDGTYTHAGVTKPWMFRLHHSPCSDHPESIFKATRLFDPQGVEAHRWKIYQYMKEAWQDYRTWGKHAHKAAPEGILAPSGAVWCYHEDGSWVLSGTRRFPGAAPHVDLYREVRRHEDRTMRAGRWLESANALLRQCLLRHLPHAHEQLHGTKTCLTVNGRKYWMKVAYEQDYGFTGCRVWMPLSWDTETTHINLDETP